MASAQYGVAYRMRVYKPRSLNDATESQLLVPTVPTPLHAEMFAVATVANVPAPFGSIATYYRPYLDVVSGVNGAIDLLEKKTSVGEMRVRVLDKRMGTNLSNPQTNLERWVTAFIGDASAKNQLAGCRVEIDECLNFDPSAPGAATWARYFTGRIMADTLESALVYTLTVRDLSDDLADMDIFTGPPHASVTYAFPSSLLPVGLQQNYGLTGNDYVYNMSPGFGTVGLAKAIGSASAFDNHTRVLQLTNGAVRLRTNSITKALADLAVGARVVGTYGGGITNFLVAIDYRGSDAQLTIPRLGKSYDLRTIYTPRPYSDSDQLWRAVYVYAEGLEADITAGAQADFYITVNKRPTEAAPYFISNAHPMQIAKDICDGKFGYLNAGAVTRTVSYDATALNALIADVTFPRANFVIPAKARALDWLEANICKPYCVVMRRDENGVVFWTDVRMRNSGTGSVTITDADCVADASQFAWSRDSKAAITRLVAKTYIDVQRKSDEERQAALGANPNLPPSLVTTREGPPYILLDNSAKARDIGDRSFEIDATGYRTFLRADGIMANVDETQGALRALVNDIMPPFAGGSETTGTLRLRRSSANATAIREGQFFTITVSRMPNPATGKRGGAMTAICTARHLSNVGEVEIGFTYIGSANPCAAPTLAAPVLSGTLPHHGATIAVTVNAASTPAELWWTATTTSVATRPADTASGWRRVTTTITASGTQTVTGLPSGQRIWWRARSIPGLDQPQQTASAFAYPPATEYVTTTALTAPSAIAVSNITVGSALTTWTNGEAQYPLVLLLRTGTLTIPTTWTSADTITLLNAGEVSYWLRAVTASNNVVGVQHVDAYGGASAVSAVAFSLTGTAETAPAMAGLGIAGGAAQTSGGGSTGVTVPTPLASGSNGIVLTLFPTRTDYDIEVQYAPDDGAGNPVTASAVSLDAGVPGTAPTYIYATPNDNTRRHFRTRHTYAAGGSVTPGAWTCWRNALPGNIGAGSALLVAQAPVMPAVSEQINYPSGTTAALVLTINDPQCRITLVEAKTRSGTGAESAYSTVTLAAGVYTCPTVTLTGQTSTTTYRITGYDAAGALGVLAVKAVAMTTTTSTTSTTDLIYVIDGGPSVLSTGIKGDLQIDFACTITAWTLLADVSGSIVVDIWRDSYANYPPTVADTITASAKPTITTATKNTSTTLTGWTTAISAGDTLRYNVDSVTSVKRVTVVLKVTVP